MALPLRRALVLAGGFGTRMKTLTSETPKPMLALQGKPILAYTIELGKRYGITDFIISLHYLPDKVREHFGDGSAYGVRITYVTEDEPLGTAGPMRLGRRELDGQPFMMCNADELKDINLDAMFAQHARTAARATIALTAVDDPTQYGVVELDGERIVRFVEKPNKEEAPSNLINAGLYIMDSSVIDLVPKGFCMVEKDIFPRLAEEGTLYGYRFSGQWFDTGTPERYARAGREWQGFREPSR